MIYGIGFNAISEQRGNQQWTIGATARRWGGNPTSRYNWQTNAWNTALDYFWRNVAVLDGATPAWKQFLDANRGHQVASALTIPTIGWVAKDTSSYSFPVSGSGPQQQTDPDVPDAGNGRDRNGKEVTPPDPQRTSVRSTPATVAAWLTTAAADRARPPAVHLVYLDNEPDLWNDTHRDVHPEPAGYDEVLARTIDYGTAIRAATPKVAIAGPASWGWWGYFYSAKDAEAGFAAKPDRRAHGDVPFLQWYLRKLRAHQKLSGIKVLDQFDVHFYPQGTGVYGGDGGGVDDNTAALRIRSTRALWDPTYTDESWIGEPVRLLPRLRELIATEYPGLGISIGEYNFGGERHISGAIAQAEALGRFGQAGVTSAFLWTYPAERTPQYWGFRAFRNFDGAGGRFLDQSIRSRSGKDVTAFASTNAGTSQVVAVLNNLSSSRAAATTVTLMSCAAMSRGPARVQQWSYAGGSEGFVGSPAAAVTRGTVAVTLAPWSVNVLRFDPGAP